MLYAIVSQSFRKRPLSAALMVISVAMGVAVAASLVTISNEIEEKLSHELRSFGANITIEPEVEGLAGLAGQKRYLNEEDLIKAKTIFWRHNIIGLAPFLEAKAVLQTSGGQRELSALGVWFEHQLPLPGEKAAFDVGLSTVLPWWEVVGSVPGKGTVVAGATAARKFSLAAGDEIIVDKKAYTVSGTLETGGPEDDALLFDLSELQALKGLNGRISKVMVSALTTPMDDFAYRDPDSMSPNEYEKWYCTGYVTSIAAQLQEAFRGSRARPVWKVAEAEGRVLKRLSFLIYILSAAALLTSALAVSTTMAAGVMKRLSEIALMKSIGADKWSVILLFFTEAVVIGLMGGMIGFTVSWFTADYIGMRVFGAELKQTSSLFFLSQLCAMLIAFLGGWAPVRRALTVRAAVVLKGG